MATKKIDTDVRDEIIKHLTDVEERNLAWLATKTDIPYATLYSIFVQKTFGLSDEKRAAINTVLNTNF